jgi:hypothetical protein
MNAITAVLAETVNDFSPTAYFASLSSMYQKANLGGINPEALAYSFSAVVSMLEIPIIQNQHAVIFDII